MGKSAVVAVLAAIVVLVWAATALGKAGDVYVASNDGVEGVYKVGPGGGAATALSTSPSFNEPWGMAMLPNGDLLVADLAADAIFQVNSRTGVTSTYLSGPALGSPVDIALGPDGFLYVRSFR